MDSEDEKWVEGKLAEDMLTEILETVQRVEGMLLAKRVQPVVEQPEPASDTVEVRRCVVHTFKGEPKILKRREKKDGSGFYWDHRDQIDGVWKKCFGKGYV
jgi:hypothetical protein